MNSSTALFFVLLQNRLSAWLLNPAKPPRNLKILGDNSAQIGQEKVLQDAFHDVMERLKGEDTAVDIIHWLVEHEGFALWGRAFRQEQNPNYRVQVLSLEWLAKRFGFDSNAQAADKKTLTQQIFPWLVSADNANEGQQMQQALLREHDTEVERLAAERQQLQQENERLRSLNAALQQVDAENLVRFLPALYPRIFTLIGAADLALLCGRVEPLAIANPYPEPSEETLRILQKDFRNLPIHLQQQIVDFVKCLPQRQKLNPRTEMRDLVSELERR